MQVHAGGGYIKFFAYNQPYPKIGISDSFTKDDDIPLFSLQIGNQFRLV
jgi:hypothetical protein